jgi:hypothetical protein
VAGRYDFTAGEVMSEAWDLVNGFKAPFWRRRSSSARCLVALQLVWGEVSPPGCSVRSRSMSSSRSRAAPRRQLMAPLFVASRRWR